MALLEVENKNLDEIHQPRVGGFTPSNFPVFSWSKYQHIHVHIISIFICTSGLSQEAMTVKNIFSFTSSSCNPLHSNSCNYCFHMNHYVLPTLQPHSPKISVLTAKTHTTTDLSYRSNCKQASCRTFLHVYFMNLTCSNFISQGTHVQLSPGGQGESDVPFCGEAPCYGWLLCGSALLRHRSACERFSLDAELPLNSLLIAVTLCTHVHPGAVGGRRIWRQLHANLAQLHSRDHCSQHGPFHRLLKLEVSLTFLHFKGHQNCTEYFQASVESPPCCCKARRNDLLSQLFLQALKADLIHCTHCVHFLLTNTEKN